MRRFLSPFKLEYLKKKEKQKLERIKKNLPKPKTYISESGEKIKYISSNN